jgi:hypothetical protein
MKLVALFVAVLAVGSSALNTAEFTLANAELQALKNAVVAQVAAAQKILSSAFWAEFATLQGIEGQVLTEVNALGSAQLTTDVTALINSIAAKISAKFYPDTVAQTILAPYNAVFSAWYTRISNDIAALNSATPPVNIACLKSVQPSINANITDLTSRIVNKVNQQLAIIQPLFNALNVNINNDLAGVYNNVVSTCGSDSACSVKLVESVLPSVSTKADAYIAQGQTDLANDVATATSKAGDLNTIFNNRYALIESALAKCA